MENNLEMALVVIKPCVIRKALQRNSMLKLGFHIRRISASLICLWVVSASVTVLASSVENAAEKVVSISTISFPNTQPGSVYSIKKFVDTKTGRVRIESESGNMRSYKDLADMKMREQKALRAKYGNLRGKLRDTFNEMELGDQVRVVIYTRMPIVKYPNKYKKSIEGLKAQSRAFQKMEPIVSLVEVSRKYGIYIEKTLGKNSFIAEVSKGQLVSMMFDNDITAIEQFIKNEPVTVNDFTSFAISAYNPAPLPADSLGQGVHAATFEKGIWQEHFDCLGNLDSNNISIIDFVNHQSQNDYHSQATFRFLWNAAPEATFYHHPMTNYIHQASQDFIVDNAIETVSISYTRSTNPHTQEFLMMDEFAYRFPFPTFANPTANSGYKYEVHWQPYNAISVGNVRHSEQLHYELAGSTQTRNADPEYGSCIDGSTGSYCAGDRELPHIVAPGIAPDLMYGRVDDNKCSIIGWATAGTSISAPTLNGIAADVISADPRMKYAPEKVRVALLLTAHNVDGGHWNATVDGRDGAGVVSGLDAVRFAKEHVEVEPNRVFPAEHGLSHGSFGLNDTGGQVELQVRVPDAKPVGKHLRVVLTWDSIPDRDLHRNTVSDLDLLFSSNKSTYNYMSMSEDSNVEIIDIPSRVLVAGETYPLTVSVSQARVPTNAVTDVFYWAVGWTWVQDHAQFDPDLNGCVDHNDIRTVFRGAIGATFDPTFDLNGDGNYNIADVRKAVTLCTNSDCMSCAP